MTDDQFDILLKAINEIRDSVESLKGVSKNGSKTHDLRDVYFEVGSVITSSDSVKTAIEELNRSVEKLSR